MKDKKDLNTLIDKAAASHKELRATAVAGLGPAAIGRHVLALLAAGTPLTLAALRDALHLTATSPSAKSGERELAQWAIEQIEAITQPPL